MKNYGSKFSPLVGAGILGIAVPASIYLIGFFTFLIWGAITLLLLPFYMLDQFHSADSFTNITAIVATVLQTLAVVLITISLSVFSKMKIYHILLSAAIFSTVFFIIERFTEKIRWANFPGTMTIFPALFKKRGIIYGSLSHAEFVEHNYYLITALFLVAACLLIVLITWAIYKVAARKEQHKDEL